MTTSIIICTRDRAASLEQTLQSLRQVNVPATLACELIIVDNASTDRTARSVASFRMPNAVVRYCPEPRPGQCYARNTGVRHAQGRVILFTDDDVRFPPDWIERMSAPILSGQAHGVAGGVSLAPQLHRPWMGPIHRHWLASTDRLDPEDPQEMVGANMAFAREVLDKVPMFDTALGPGSLGFADDTLFSYQIKQGGFEIISALDIAVEHHCETSRLSRKAFLHAARQRGESWAYVTHHWMHRSLKAPMLRLAKWSLLLHTHHIWHSRGCCTASHICPSELSAVCAVHFYIQYLKERRQPYRYERRGLTLLAGALRSTAQ